LPSKDWYRNLGRLLNGRPAAAHSQADPKKKELELIPGNELSSKLDAWWWLVAAVVAVVAYLIIFKSDPYWNILKFVSDGLGITVFLTVVSMVFIILVGIIGGLGRIAKNPVIHGISTIYVEIIRGIPLLIQLIWWYFAFPIVIRSIGQGLHIQLLAEYKSNALFLAVVGLVICYGAYMSEIFRAGIQSISKGQIEAARSQGMTYLQAMRYVIMPQAFKVVLPPVGNEFIMLLKDTSLVSVVAVADLTRRGNEFMAAHFNALEVWTFVALLYLIMTLLATRLISALEKRRHS
jgi:polar amino acid transport system permease protein